MWPCDLLGCPPTRCTRGLGSPRCAVRPPQRTCSRAGPRQLGSSSPRGVSVTISQDPGPARPVQQRCEQPVGTTRVAVTRFHGIGSLGVCPSSSVVARTGAGPRAGRSWLAGPGKLLCWTEPTQPGRRGRGAPSQRIPASEDPLGFPLQRWPGDARVGSEKLHSRDLIFYPELSVALNKNSALNSG